MRAASSDRRARSRLPPRPLHGVGRCCATVSAMCGEHQHPYQVSVMSRGVAPRGVERGESNSRGVKVSSTKEAPLPKVKSTAAPTLSATWSPPPLNDPWRNATAVVVCFLRLGRGETRAKAVRLIG